MRRTVMIGAGVASAAVLAIAGVASANTSGRTPAAAATAASTAAATPVSRADAERAARRAVPGGTITETRAATVGGRAVWLVHMAVPKAAVEVTVDARTGAVTLRTDRSGDDPAGHDAADDRTTGADDPAGHDAGDDRGVGADDPAGHDAGDDHGQDGGGHR